MKKSTEMPLLIEDEEFQQYKQEAEALLGIGMERYMSPRDHKWHCAGLIIVTFIIWAIVSTVLCNSWIWNQAHYEVKLGYCIASSVGVYCIISRICDTYLTQVGRGKKCKGK